jgi:hypothetical protein
MGFHVIDQIIVGLLGADAVAAVGLSNSVASIALLLYASADVGVLTEIRDLLKENVSARSSDSTGKRGVSA